METKMLTAFSPLIEVRNHLRYWFFLRAIKHRLELLRYLLSKNSAILPTPHLVKIKTIIELANRYSIRTLIETGTYLGDTVFATRNTFDRIISIEIDRELYERARRRFSKFSHITILLGDSGKVLPNLLPGIDTPCVFFLDAHYSGGITSKGNSQTPIRQELEAILNHKVQQHVVIIDDARDFTGGDYPIIEELRDFIRAKRHLWIFEVKDGLIIVDGFNSLA